MKVWAWGVKSTQKKILKMNLIRGYPLWRAVEDNLENVGKEGRITLKEMVKETVLGTANCESFSA
jgi:hypothetical protein